MYRFLTDDSTSEVHYADIDKRLEVMLDDPDVDLVVDKREINPGRPSHLHGPDVAHLPIAISISDLIKKVAEKLPCGTPVPSEPWVRFQFWPRNRFSKIAKHYNCRFDVKYKIQSRQLRKSHINSQYCAVLLRYLKKGMACKLCITFFLDDKSKIPVGMSIFCNVIFFFFFCVCVCV